MKTPILLRISKEARTLLPLWVITLIAIVAPFLILTHDARPAGFSIAAYCLGSALLSATCFGHEFTHRTMGLLLSQPVPRKRIWMEKMIVLGAMLLGTMFLFFVLWWWHGSYYEVTDTPVSTALLIIGPVVIAFCVGPTVTLLVRGVIMGTAMTLLFPLTLIILSLTIASVRYGPDEAEKWMPSYFLILQTIFCAFFLPLGLRVFRGFEDSGATSPEASLPIKVTAPFKSLPSILTLGQRGPIASLIRKELHLQQPTCLVAAVIVLVWLALVVLKIFRPFNPVDALVLAPFILGMLGIPIVAGIISVAEERNLGVHDWQLTLPVSARRQWLIKTITTLFTSMTFGVGLPFLLGHISVALFDSSHAMPRADFKAFPWVNLTLTAMALYASTFSTNTLRAMVATVTLIIAGGTLLVIATNYYRLYLPVEFTILIYFTLLYVAFEMGLANFRRVLGSIWKPVRQIALLVGILIVLLFFFKGAGRIHFSA